MSQGPVRREIRRYLESGGTDPLFSAWRGQDLLTTAREAEGTLRRALVDEVRRRAAGRMAPPLPPDFHPARFARTKLAPMVDGLFPAAERSVVLGLLERSTVFLTDESIERVIIDTKVWLSTAWKLANIYLESLDLPPLGDDHPCIVGLSEETRCYVSASYFSELAPFADFVVHEAAHVFHNCRREPVGLPHTRNREWLLPIAFRKREPFAYACEAYSRILDGASGPAGRRELLGAFAEGQIPSDAGDPVELVDILTEAVAARNGWKRILSRCSDYRPGGRGRSQPC
jgi:hypothetical protein